MVLSLKNSLFTSLTKSENTLSEGGKSIFKTRKMFVYIHSILHACSHIFRALPGIKMAFCMHVCLPSLTAVKMPSRRSFLTFCFQMKKLVVRKWTKILTLKLRRTFPTKLCICICSYWSKGIYLKSAFENLSKFLQRFRKKEKKSLLKWNKLLTKLQ